MSRTLLVLAAGIVIGVSGFALSHDEKAEVKRKIVSEKDIVEKLDGKEAKATVVEVTLEPGQESVSHRHPGPVFGYVLEGEYEHAINDEPTKVLKAGETFYEPGGCLHRVSKNPGKVKTRVLATILHPRDAKQISVPEPAKK
jgi:quercetin dioxygenase-like cupin family protein